MILIDMSQVILGNVFGYARDISKIDEDVVRHMTLNSLRMYKNKFEKKYGDMVQTLMVEYGYNEASAEEIITFASNNLWRDS